MLVEEKLRLILYDFFNRKIHLPVQAEDQEESKCNLLKRIHCRRPTATDAECLNGSLQWSPDVRAIGLGVGWLAMFGVMQLPFESTVGLLHGTFGYDKVEFVFLAWQFSIESFDCSSKDFGESVWKVLASWGFAEFVYVTATVKSQKNHWSLMAAVDKLTSDVNAKWVWNGTKIRYEDLYQECSK